MSLKIFSNVEKLNADDVRVHQLSSDTDGIIAAYYDLSGNPSVFMSGASANLGFVGIKTDTPNEALTINGNVSASGGYYGLGVGNVTGDFELIAGEHVWYVKGASGNIEVPGNKGIQGGNYGGNQVMFPVGFGLQLNSLSEGTTYIQTGSAGSVNKTWAFSNDGALTLPLSGNIVGLTNLSATNIYTPHLTANNTGATIYGDLSCTGRVYASDVHAPLSVTDLLITTKTLALSDVNSIITGSDTADMDVYVPANSAVSFPVGTEIKFIQLGTKKIHINANAGVDLANSSSQFKTKGQHAVTWLFKVTTDQWIFAGDTSA